MHKPFFIPIFLILLFPGINFSCSSSNANTLPPDPLTEKFGYYLESNFEDSIPENPHFFILIAHKDSRENVSKILTRLNPEIQNKKPENFSSIISVNMPIADSLIPIGKNHMDWNAAIDELPMNLSSVTLIKTDSRKVVEILPLTIEATGMEKRFLDN